MLILDGHRAHRARIVKDWAAANSELIELHFLPGYSPELNPAECLNQDVKTNALAQAPTGQRRRADGRRAPLPTHLPTHHRQRYFQERHVRYAAA
jgi:transposase